MSDAQPSFCKAFNDSVLSHCMIARWNGKNCQFVVVLDNKTYEEIAMVLVLNPMRDGVSLGSYLTLNVRLGDCTKMLFASHQMDTCCDDLTRLLPVLHRHCNLKIYENKFYCFKSLYLCQNQKLPLELIKYILEFLLYL